MFFKKRKKAIDNNIPKVNKKNDTRIILPFYLNQRFVYDMLAIMNNGFTDLIEITNTESSSADTKANVNANFGTNNEFTLIQTSVSGELETGYNTGKDNTKKFTKTHTASSLFMQVYNLLSREGKIKILNSGFEFSDIKSGDFVELKSKITINSMVDFFHDFDLVIDITDAMSKLGNENGIGGLNHFKKATTDILKVVDSEKEKIRYGICNVDNKNIVVKLNKDYFINSDMKEIKNGEFTIIGKIMEIVPSEASVILNRENAFGMYDPKIFEAVKEAMKNMEEFNFDEIIDKIQGPTCIIFPIAIGI